jgi:hypothetical protein
MASFDVTSLFTNIPLDETIDIICNRLFCNAVRYHGLTQPELRKLLGFAVKNCHFLFNGVLYHQIDGVVMGSPLGPLFANIFLSFHEADWLNNCPTAFKPLLYRRYVDDCFLLFHSADQVRAVARGVLGWVVNPPPNFCRINIFGKSGWPFGKLRQ